MNQMYYFFWKDYPLCSFSPPYHLSAQSLDISFPPHDIPCINPWYWSLLNQFNHFFLSKFYFLVISRLELPTWIHPPPSLLGHTGNCCQLPYISLYYNYNYSKYQPRLVKFDLGKKKLTGLIKNNLHLNHYWCIQSSKLCKHFLFSQHSYWKFVIKKVACCLVFLCASNSEEHSWTSPESRLLACGL